MPLVVSEGPAHERKNPVQNEPDDSGPGAYMGGFWEKQPERVAVFASPARTICAISVTYLDHNYSQKETGDSQIGKKNSTHS